MRNRRVLVAPSRRLCNPPSKCHEMSLRTKEEAPIADPEISLKIMLGNLKQGQVQPWSRIFWRSGEGQHLKPPCLHVLAYDTQILRCARGLQNPSSWLRAQQRTKRRGTWKHGPCSSATKWSVHPIDRRKAQHLETRQLEAFGSTLVPFTLLPARSSVM